MKRQTSVNRMYRLGWSRVRNTWIAVSENAKEQEKSGRGKPVLRRRILVAALSLAFAPLAFAGPLGGQVILGSGSILQSGAITTIQQTSQNLSLDWQSFNIAKQETVNFQQPSATAIAVNHILDTNGSQILGHLNANGQVWLINPNGVLFGQDAQVNVGGLVASTLKFNDAALNGNVIAFSGSGIGSVLNQGTINVANGGYVALLGNHVSNQGTITAPLGTVALGAGSATTLTFAGNSLVHLQIDQSTLNNLAENGGLIQADGGQVILNAGAKDAVLASVVNNTGIIEARTVENHAGIITLLGGMTAGAVNVGGTLDASALAPYSTGGVLERGAPSGMNSSNGGFIETSAAHINVASNAKVTTDAPNGLAGTWLIDPVDFTIAASGGNITGATLSANLGAGNVSILSSNGTVGTAGNINVNDAVTWSTNKLTLNAQNNINIIANLNGSGTASLALVYGQGAVAAGNASNYFLNNGMQVNLAAGNNFSTKLGSDGNTVNYTVITSLGAAGSTTGTDLQGMNGYLAGNYVLGSDIVATPTSGWNNNAGFTPIGNGTAAFTGAFDGLGHTISNLTINLPTTTNVGLFGYTDTGSLIRNVGLVGGSVSGSNAVGGLVGYSRSSMITNSYATGSVTGSLYGSSVGGLVGSNWSEITNSYATGSVTGGVYGLSVGGLAGSNSGTINNSYATGKVSGNNFVGGLVGYNNGTVDSSYATGSISGTSYAGGLVGYNDGSIVSTSYWNTTTAGVGVPKGIGFDSATSLPSDIGAAGLTASQMMQLASFSAWNTVTPHTIANTSGGGGIWRIYEGHTTPLLTSFLTPLTLADAPDITVTYNSTVQHGATTSIGGVSGSAAAGINAGFYNGYYSNQQGFDIAGGNLVINPASILSSISMTGTRTYDGTTNVAASIFTLSGLMGNQTLTLTGTGSIASKNIGTYSVNLGTLTLNNGKNGGLAGNYTFAGGIQTATITPLAITVSATGSNRVYNATVNDIVSLASMGLISGDRVSFTDTSATFANKKVGNNKIVTVTGITANGADAGNYILSNTKAKTTANITPKSITVSATAADKMYDGKIKDTATLSSTGVIAGDVLNFVDTSVVFGDKNAGNGKTVIVSGIKARGKDAGNYAISSSTVSTTANITPKSIVVSAKGTSKVYDGTLNDTVIFKGKGVIRGDIVAFTDTSATFADKNVGTGKLVNISGISAIGVDAGNYLFNTTAMTLAKITPLAITVIATGINKAYDGTLTAAATLASTGIILGDVVNFSYVSAKFSDKNAGVNKIVTVTGITESGADAGDYKLTNTKALTTANVH
jgi:filamentous hemagglutinin family protein